MSMCCQHQPRNHCPLHTFAASDIRAETNHIIILYSVSHVAQQLGAIPECSVHRPVILDLDYMFLPPISVCPSVRYDRDAHIRRQIDCNLHRCMVPGDDRVVDIAVVEAWNEVLLARLATAPY